MAKAPPPLARDSHAYRFAGFGTNEYVIYYYLLRHLLSVCLERLEVAQTLVREDSEVAQTSVCVEESASVDPQSEIRNPKSEVAWLEELKQAWLNEQNEDFDGRIPSAIIESERRRIPLVMSAKSMMIDEDCDLCRLMGGETGEDFGPGFWHLDGCNMDEGFVFSTYRSREEWEEAERRRKEFDEEFNRKWAQGRTSDL